MMSWHLNARGVGGAMVLVLGAMGCAYGITTADADRYEDGYYGQGGALAPNQAKIDSAMLLGRA